MPQTTAERMRAYRARKAAAAPPVTPPECEQCHHPFTRRGDARFCSDSCRAAHWRTITHRRQHHDPAGFTIPANQPDAGDLQWCTHQTDDTTFCHATATWWIATFRNGDPVYGVTWRCDDHADELTGPCDPDAACHHPGGLYGGNDCPLDAVATPD